MRTSGDSPATSPGPDPSLDPGTLRRVAEDCDFSLAVLERRGPVQSRPEWELAVAEADDASRTAWRRYADVLFG